MNEKEYKQAFVDIEKLVDLDPEKGTKEYEKLISLALKIKEYESKEK